MSDKKIKQNNNINKFKKNNTGFTIIELLIVLGISIILATAAAPLYGSLQVSAQLNENSSLIIQSLRTARERSIAGYNNIQHGVFFDINTGAVDSYTLYQGSSYVARPLIQCITINCPSIDIKKKHHVEYYCIQHGVF